MDPVGAFLFVKRFLAHATDGGVAVEEWHALSTPTPTLAIEVSTSGSPWQERVEEAAATYDVLLRESGPGTVVALFWRCVQTVHEAYKDSPEVLADLLDTCHALALADGHVDAMEEHFLQQITAVWGTHEAHAEAPMDILEAYLYMTRYLAEADSYLDDREWDAIRNHLSQHGQEMGATPSRCRDALEAACRLHRRLLVAGPDATRAHFNACADALGATFAQGGGLEPLLHELWTLAAVDGTVAPEEEALLHDLERRWLLPA